MKKAIKRSPEEFMIEKIQEGGVSLILGAGVSSSVGLPKWDQLGQRLWDRAFPPDKESPCDSSNEKSPHSLPRFLPIVFELALDKLGEKGFDELSKCIYDGNGLKLTAKELAVSTRTLATIARVIVREYKAGRRRKLARVITFNIDDLLEQAVKCLQPGIVLRSVIPREHDSSRPQVKEQPIPIYHLHGIIPYKPKDPRRERLFEHFLVFTDTQYWASSSTVMSYANRTMGYALQEGPCLFIGLSMTDINILRWLALRSIELDRDIEEMQKRIHSASGLSTQEQQNYRSRSRIAKHFWIRPESDDPTGILSEFLSKMRGVRSIQIGDWTGPDLSDLLEKCFPGD